MSAFTIPDEFRSPPHCNGRPSHGPEAAYTQTERIFNAIVRKLVELDRGEGGRAAKLERIEKAARKRIPEPTH